MKIYFPKADLSIGSQRIPFHVYKNALVSRFGVQPVGYSEVAKADIAITLAGTGMSQRLAADFPHLRIVSAKPHIEKVTTTSKPSLHLRLTSYVYYLFNHNARFIDQVNHDNACSHLLLCDTPRLLRHFSAKNYNSMYLPLIDVYSAKVVRKNTKKDETVNILFHGNLSHYNANICILIDSIGAIIHDPLTHVNQITIHCISGFGPSLPQSKRVNPHLSIKYYRYSTDVLSHLLSICDIGWAPNQYTYSTLMDSKLFRALFTTCTQEYDQISISKFSSNFGRALLFAQYAIPFITHPCEEMASVFSCLASDVIYDDTDSLRSQLTKLMDPSNRSKVSEELRAHFNYRNFLDLHTERLYNELQRLLVT